MALIREFISDETGATAIEYGLIAALIAMAIIASVSTLGNDISGTFGVASNTLESTHTQ